MFGGDVGALGVEIGGCDWLQRISTFRTAILQKIEARGKARIGRALERIRTTGTADSDRKLEPRMPTN